MAHQLGIVLSGGGIRGVAHIGLIKALMEEDLRPTAVAGTSAGAIVGALYAAGHSPDEMLELFKETSLFDWSNYSLNKPGLLESENFLPLLTEYLGEKTFADLEHELFVATTDLLQGDCHIFDSGPVARAVLASAAFPFVFTPVKIEDGLFADGGTVNNFPVEPLLDRCEHLVGSYVNPVEPVALDDIDSTFDILQRTYRIATNYSSIKKMEQCDWSMAPPELTDYNIFDLKRADEIFEIGYEAGKALVQEMDL